MPTAKASSLDERSGIEDKRSLRFLDSVTLHRGYSLIFQPGGGLIKAYFSRRVAKGERISRSRQKRGERGLWQRRFWEHLIRDETDYRQHIDYIHWNPVKHGWVSRVKDWPHSSFHGYVAQGIYPENWGNETELPDITVRE
jgi:putative transposase